MQLFTLDEAEALLPQIREEVLAMQAAKRGVDELRGELEHLAGTSASNGHVRDEAALAEKRRRAEALVDEINERLSRISGWGVEFKGIDEGLVDFPSKREGRVVYLCWRSGEERIEWWHEVDAGFAGRTAL